MKRLFQIRLSTLLIVFLIMGAIIAAYAARTKSLEEFRRIENRLSDFLPRALDQELVSSIKLSNNRGLTPVVCGVTGGGTSYGGLFRESNFDKTYRDKIRFREQDDTEQWPDGYNVSIRIVGRLGIYDSRPTIEITNVEGKYSPLAIASVKAFAERELGIVPLATTDQDQK